MRSNVRTGLTGWLLLLGMLVPASAMAQQAPATKAASRPAPSPGQMAKLNQVLATVNSDKITAGQLLQFLGQYQIPPGGEKMPTTRGWNCWSALACSTSF